MDNDMALAVTAIVEFGYTLEADGALVKYKGQAKRPVEKYEPVEGGFLRFTRVDGEWQPVALSVNEAGAGLSGLDMRNPAHAGMFEWVYPADYLLNIYAEAVQARG